MTGNRTRGSGQSSAWPPVATLLEDVQGKHTQVLGPGLPPGEARQLAAHLLKKCPSLEPRAQQAPQTPGLGQATGSGRDPLSSSSTSISISMLSYPCPLLLPGGVRLSSRALLEGWRQQVLQGGHLHSVAGTAFCEGESGWVVACSSTPRGTPRPTCLCTDTALPPVPSDMGKGCCPEPEEGEHNRYVRAWWAELPEYIPS